MPVSFFFSYFSPTEKEKNHIYKGIPATAYKFLLRQVLREEMDFDGVVSRAYLDLPGLQQELAEKVVNLGNLLHWYYLMVVLWN